MEQTKTIHNLIILDESGSMHSIYKQALTGANETIQTIRCGQKDDPSTIQYLTFVTFDSGSSREDVREIISHRPIAEVQDLTERDYEPNGCTPLYDAMGISITRLEKLVQEGDRVLVTVITDGCENSSREYSASKVKALVERLRAKGWIFTYIGANQDSVEVAGKIGINNSMDFQADALGSEMMWAKMNSSRREYYRKVKMNIDVNACVQEDFFLAKRGSDRVTPDWVSSLAPDEVLVVGGHAFGLAGQRFVIRTDHRDLHLIGEMVARFIELAEEHPSTRFLVTRIGCGGAGWTDEQIAPLFAGAYSVPNIALPQSFWKVLDYKYRR